MTTTQTKATATANSLSEALRALHGNQSVDDLSARLGTQQDTIETLRRASNEARGILLSFRSRVDISTDQRCAIASWLRANPEQEEKCGGIRFKKLKHPLVT